MSTMVSPMLHSSISHPHSPLNLSPAGSPSLRPTNPGKSHTYSPSPSGTITPLGPFPNPLPSSLGQGRSYARQPTQRPYQSALVARASVGGAGGRAVRAVQGDSLKFADLVMGIMESRGLDARKGGLGLDVKGQEEAEGSKGSNIRASKSLAGSLAGSYEAERAELIVDVPVWSPGCFQDLSTLHALRDTTLSHTHSLLAHFMAVHGLPASYRLLARSAITQGRGRGKASNSGWGCIRLAPYANPTTAGRPELKPKIRRSSMDLNDSRDRPFTAQERPHRSTMIKSLTSPIVPMAGVTGLHDATPLASGMKTPEMRLEEAIADDDEPVLEDVQLKTGYRSGSVSDDEDEDDADTLVAREVERRGAKEGTAFLMTLFGGPALILV